MSATLTPKRSEHKFIVLQQALICTKENEPNLKFISIKHFSLFNDISDPAIRAQILFSRADLKTDQADYSNANQDLYKIVALYPANSVNVDLGVAYRKLGDNYLFLNRHNDAFNALFNSRFIFQAAKESLHLADTFGRIGSIYRTLGDFDKALENLLGSIQALEGTVQKRKLAIAYNNTAIVYKDLERFDDAIAMHLKSLNLKKELGYERGQIYSHNNLGETFRLKGERDKAQFHLDKAKALAEKLNNQALLGSNYLYRARMAIEVGEYGRALSFLDTAMAIYKTRKSQSRIADASVEYGHIYLIKKDFVRSEFFYNQAKEIAQEIEKNTVMFAAYKGLVDLYSQQQQFQKAYETLKTYHQKERMLFDKQSQKRLESLIVENQLFASEQALKLARQDARLKQAKIDATNFKLSSIIGAIVICVVIAWLLYRKQQQQKALRIEQLARSEIEVSEQRLNLALWASGDVLWDWNLTENTIKRENLNDTTRQPQFIKGNTIDAVKPYIHPDDFKKLADKFNAHLNGIGDFFEATYRVMDAQGQWRWILDRGKVVEKDKHGNAVRVAGTQRDVSLLKQQETVLQELNEDLEQRVTTRTSELDKANQELTKIIEQLKLTQDYLVEAEKNAALGNMIAGLAHEINTPLGTAITAVSHLKQQTATTLTQYQNKTLSKNQFSGYLAVVTNSSDLIETGVGRAGELVERFKQLAVSDNEQASQVKLHEVVNNCFELLKVNKPELIKSVSLENEAYGEITSYLSSLTQVIYILMENSVEHGQAESLIINCRLEVNDSGLNFIYTDSGCGIEPDAEAHLFEPFYTTSRHRGNAGLGLHLAYNLVNQLLHGNIQYFKPEQGGIGFKLNIQDIVN